jgi:hypothetical protein
MSIYLISAPCHGTRKCKIGITKETKKRRDQYLTGCCPEDRFEMNYLAVWQVDACSHKALVAHERQVHEHFKAYRMDGKREWFQFPGRGALVDVVASYIEAQPWCLGRVYTATRAIRKSPPLPEPTVVSPTTRGKKASRSPPTAPAPIPSPVSASPAPNPSPAPALKRMTWETAVLAACRAEAAKDPSRVFTRKALVDRHLSTIVVQTASKGKTPDMTLSWMIQILRDKGHLVMLSSGQYQLCSV